MPFRRPVIRARVPKGMFWVLPSVLALALVAGLGGYLLDRASGSQPAALAEAGNGVIDRGAITGSTRPAPVTPSPRPASPSAPSGSFTHAPQGGGTANPAAGAPSTCSDPVWSSSADQGTWNGGSFPVNNNVWNTSEAGPQTIDVCDSSSWYVVSDQPNLSSDPGSVKSYPSVGEFFSGTQTVGSFQDITSTFGVSIPALGEWDSGYDIWTNNWGNELMIQNDTHEHPEDPAPPGSIPVTIDGIQYNALQVSSTFTVLVMNDYVTSGTVNILHVFQWLESQGWMSPSDTLTAIGYGVEISVTQSSPGVQGPERFDLTNFSLSAS